MWSMLQSKNITYAMLQDEATIVAVAILLIFLCCLVVMLQSRLTRAAGHWLQHEASRTEHRKSRLTARCGTSAAELYYLHHSRSCAATATGNKGGHPGQTKTLEICGAAWIFCVVMSLLQSISRMWQCCAKTTIKLICRLLAMLQSTLQFAQEVALGWLSPLELVACLHLANAEYSETFTHSVAEHYHQFAEHHGNVKGAERWNSARDISPR